MFETPKIERIQSIAVIRAAESLNVARTVAGPSSCESHSASLSEGKSVPPVESQLLSGPSTSRLGARSRSGGLRCPGQAWIQKRRMFFTRSWWVSSPSSSAQLSSSTWPGFSVADTASESSQSNGDGVSANQSNSPFAALSSDAASSEPNSTTHSPPRLT